MDLLLMILLIGITMGFTLIRRNSFFNTILSAIYLYVSLKIFTTGLTISDTVITPAFSETAFIIFFLTFIVVIFDIIFNSEE